MNNQPRHVQVPGLVVLVWIGAAFAVTLWAAGGHGNVDADVRRLALYVGSALVGIGTTWWLLASAVLYAIHRAASDGGKWAQPAAPKNAEASVGPSSALSE